MEWRVDSYSWMRIINLMVVLEKRRERVVARGGEGGGQGDVADVGKGATGGGNVNLGNATGTTTVGSLVTNISTTGAATVNIGNTGTSVTAGSIVNIGTGATGINLGNAATLFNVIGKVRLSSNPVLSYYFTTGQTQNISNTTNTPVKYPTASTRNGTGTGITYNSTTGYFTNSNSYSVVVVVSTNIFFPQSTIGRRILSIITTTSTEGFSQVNTGSEVALNITASFILNTGETFYGNCYQESGGTLTIPAIDLTRISIVVL
jgi:hypothetical protein